jgi:hypothetical protein
MDVVPPHHELHRWVPSVFSWITDFRGYRVPQKSKGDNKRRVLLTDDLKLV